MTTPETTPKAQLLLALRREGGTPIADLQRAIADEAARSDIECFCVGHMGPDDERWLFEVDTTTDITDRADAFGIAASRRAAEYLILRDLVEVVPARGRLFVRFLNGAGEGSANA